MCAPRSWTVAPTTNLPPALPPAHAAPYTPCQPCSPVPAALQLIKDSIIATPITKVTSPMTYTTM